MNISIEASMLFAFFAAAGAGWLEIMGQKPCAVLVQCEGEDFWKTLNTLLAEHAYPQTRDGLAMRAGRAAFYHFIGQQGDALGLTQLDFRLKPVQERLAVGWLMLTTVCDQAVAATLTSEVQEGYCLRSETPLSASQAAFLCGFLQEFLYWASQGRVYPLNKRDVNGFCFGKEALTL
jgi:hypothetical protein